MIFTNKPGSDALRGGKPPQPDKMGENAGRGRQSEPRAQGVGSRKLWFLGAHPPRAAPPRRLPRLSQVGPGTTKQMGNIVKCNGCHYNMASWCNGQHSGP